MWTVRDPSIDWPIIDEIEKAGDRAAAILAASMIEDRLEKAVKTFLHEDKEITPAMFEGLGPLASFSAKARMGFVLGIYGEPMLKTLNRIGQIRNRFAHELEVNSFTHPKVSGIVSLLDPSSIIQKVSHEKIKGAFAGTSIAIKPAKDRQRFIDTIQVTLMLLELYRTYSEHKPHTPSF
jgi:DNA-binding MltR family transcriptional regulator